MLQREFVDQLADDLEFIGETLLKPDLKMSPSLRRTLAGFIKTTAKNLRVVSTPKQRKKTNEQQPLAAEIL